MRHPPAICQNLRGGGGGGWGGRGGGVLAGRPGEGGVHATHKGVCVWGGGGGMGV